MSAVSERPPAAPAGGASGGLSDGLAAPGLQHLGPGVHRPDRCLHRLPDRGHDPRRWDERVPERRQRPRDVRSLGGARHRRRRPDAGDPGRIARPLGRLGRRSRLDPGGRDDERPGLQDRPGRPGRAPVRRRRRSRQRTGHHEAPSKRIHRDPRHGSDPAGLRRGELRRAGHRRPRRLPAARLRKRGSGA